MNIMKYFRMLTSRINIFLLFILVVVNIIYAQKKTIALIENYSKAASPGLTSNAHINADSLIQYLTTLGLKTYTWQIDKDNSWDDLKLSLPDLKIAGISIYVSLMPLTNNSPSQPFGFDFITWSREIANLSLRYSNLKGFSIKDFQQNVNLNYFKQNYIDSIGTVGTSINLKLQFINAGKLHLTFYVDKNATGNKSGSSWINAANSVSAVFKANPNIGLTPNDTVYISGGTDSTVYPADGVVNKRPANLVVIAPGKDIGHNGKVVFERAVSGGFSETCSFGFIHCKNFKFTGFTLRNNMDISYYALAIMEVFYCTNVTTDNCNIYSSGNGDGSHNSTDTSCAWTNNYILIDSARALINTTHTRDALFINFGAGGHTITGNKLINRSFFGAAAHPDCIQMEPEGSTDLNLPMVIADNLFQQDNLSSKAGQGIYMEEAAGNRLYIYNNVFVMNDSSNAPLTIWGANGGHNSVRIFNNTFVLYTHKTIDWAIPMVVLHRGIDTAIVENNIIKETGTSHIGAIPLYYGTHDYSEITYLVSDYNQFDYGKFNRNMFTLRLVWSYDVSHQYTWSQWQTLGFDTHSDTGNVSLVNIWGTNISDYKLTSGSICIDKGTPLLIFNTDIEGRFRPQGRAWDKGAFEQ